MIALCTPFVPYASMLCMLLLISNGDGLDRMRSTFPCLVGLLPIYCQLLPHDRALITHP